MGWVGLVQVSPLGSLGSPTHWDELCQSVSNNKNIMIYIYYIYVYVMYIYIYILTIIFIYINYYINNFFRVSLWSSFVVLAFSTASLTIPAFSSRSPGRETEDLWRKGQRVWGAPEGAIQRHRWTNIRLPETSRILKDFWKSPAVQTFLADWRLTNKPCWLMIVVIPWVDTILYRSL